MPSEFPELAEIEQAQAERRSYHFASILVLCVLAAALALVRAYSAYFAWNDQPVELELAPVAVIPTSVISRPDGKYLYIHTDSFESGAAEDTDESCALKMNPVTCASPDYYVDFVERGPGTYEIEHIYTHLSRPGNDVFGMVGYMNLCGGLYAEPVTSLPHRIEDQSQAVVVNAVNMDGSVVATFGGQTYRMLPGQAWVKRSVRNDLTCGTVRREEWVVNYGWTDETKIDWGGE